MHFMAKFSLAVMTVAFLLGNRASAMTIEDFGRMNNDDEAGFVTALVEASSKMLKAHGRPDQAAQVISFFKMPGEHGGVYQFADHMKAAFALNKRNAINPNNRIAPLQVEDAMASTLKSIDIIVPAPYLIASGKSFAPTGLPRSLSGGF